ncbi:hypothetical protein [Vreelandella aquamarina]|uniref:hypothetical protein n=1 Tax=Vreelandella aquamarina TaxID=77097 RepID=UPI00384E6FBB
MTTPNQTKPKTVKLIFSEAVAISVMMATISLPSFAGSFNHRVEQYYSDTPHHYYQGNYSIIKQMGSHNSANVYQSYSARYQAGNFSRIHQQGNWNAANIEQSGGNNIGVILQRGNHHIANISQSGNEKQIETYISQTGHYSDIQVSQSGSGYRGISVEQQAFSASARPVTVETY